MRLNWKTFGDTPLKSGQLVLCRSRWIIQSLQYETYDQESLRHILQEVAGGEFFYFGKDEKYAELDNDDFER